MIKADTNSTLIVSLLYAVRFVSIARLNIRATLSEEGVQPTTKAIIHTKMIRIILLK